MSHKHTSLGTHYTSPLFQVLNEHTGHNNQVDMSHDYSAEENGSVVTATLLLTFLIVTCHQRSFRLSQSHDSLVFQVKYLQRGDELHLSCFF